MAEIIRAKKYDLEDRCAKFAKEVRDYVKKLPKDLSNVEYARQLIRSSGSVGANYIEANESLSRKDFFMRIKISRKEAKETEYWLCLTECIDTDKIKKETLIKEAGELRRIFGAIVQKQV